MVEKDPDLVLMAQIGAAHGIRGEVRVKPFGSDPMALADYGPLRDKTGSREFTIQSLRPQKSVLVVRFKNISSRNEAEALKGTELYVRREALPPADEDEFYHIDIIGLTVFTVNEDHVGTVIAIPDFGAGELLEVKPERGPSYLIPFTEEIVPHIDLNAGRIIIDPPEGLLVHQTKPDETPVDEVQ